ncbi:MAG: two pore domain potassium channel family protein [Gammaproteobacteria bacterium]|nr:two pore domain potassium channel family protein [Gammaproteobacteria bacterium]MDX2461007.1 two pore domain potassium channel family protein [Gammaproteobacteria bacterium]
MQDLTGEQTDEFEQAMRTAQRHARFKRFMEDISVHTPFTKMVLLLTVLWLIFSAGVYVAERSIEGTSINSYGEALYWGVAAFSTAGIANAPISSTAQLVGGIWIVLGSVLFFGTIVATVTSYFMRPMQRPHKKIIDTIEYNLEQLNDLTLDELDLLRETVDMLIDHVERLKEKQLRG